MVNQDSLPEHVRDSKLYTSFQADLTIHTRPSCRRNAPPKETWCQEKVLGHGGNGVVWLQRRTNRDHMAPALRAVKQIWVPNDSRSSEKSYLRELEALSKFSQYRYRDFFVQSYGWYNDNSYLYIAMEYCEHGDLRAYLKSTGILPENQVQDIAAQVLGGLSIMHQAGFAHRDIKPANILIKTKPPDDWWVKVSDLGLSKRNELTAGPTTVRGTPGFMPPETVGIHRDQGAINPSSADMWCFGETVFQMLSGDRTFGNIMELVNYYNGHNQFPTRAMERASASEEAVDFVRLLMAAIPSDRLTAAQAQNHRWMAPSLEQFKTLSEPTELSKSTPFDPGENQDVTPPSLVGGDMTQATAAWSTTTVQYKGTIFKNLSDNSSFLEGADIDEAHKGIPASGANSQTELSIRSQHVAAPMDDNTTEEPRHRKPFFIPRLRGSPLNIGSNSVQSGTRPSETQSLEANLLGKQPRPRILGALMSPRPPRASKKEKDASEPKFTQQNPSEVPLSQSIDTYSFGYYPKSMQRKPSEVPQDQSVEPYSSGYDSTPRHLDPPGPLRVSRDESPEGRPFSDRRPSFLDSVFPKKGKKVPGFKNLGSRDHDTSLGHLSTYTKEPIEENSRDEAPSPAEELKPEGIAPKDTGTAYPAVSATA